MSVSNEVQIQNILDRSFSMDVQLIIEEKNVLLVKRLDREYKPFFTTQVNPLNGCVYWSNYDQDFDSACEDFKRRVKNS